MDLPLSTQAYDRSTTGGALEILRNMYSESQPATNGRTDTLLSRAGVDAYLQGYEGGNVRAFLSENELFDGDIFSVHGTNFYRTDSAGAKTLLGAVPATGIVTMAATRNEVLICIDPGLYSYNGTDFVPVVLPGFGVSSVANIAQRFVATSNSIDRWYWSDELDGRTWDGLNFKTAEGRSDKAVRAFTTEKYVVIYGTESTEVYGLNSNPSTPSDLFYRIVSGAMSHGLLAPRSLTKEDSFLFWLSERKTIYVASGFRPTKISTPAIHDMIDKVPDASLALAEGYSYTLSGHTFYVLTVPGYFTIVYDLGSQKWIIHETLSRNTWIAEIGLTAFNKVIAASLDGPDLYEVRETATLDITDNIVQEFSVAQPVRDAMIVDDLTIDMRADADATATMRFTETGGSLWTDGVDVRVPSPGFENAQAMWRDLGTARAPERIYKIRVSEPCNLTVRGARINDGAA